jgi:lipopolysaccharide transport system ATP-binding protein
MLVIKIDNLSKQYRLGTISTRTLSHDLDRWWTINIRRKEDPYLRIGEGENGRGVDGVTLRRSGGKEDGYIWALRDINLDVEQGQVLGIIGKNGAGKSTLLKILSKVTAPTTGTVKASGRIASLLEVGTGFHPEMTGRENIFMNGSILGMTKTEIQRKFDEIVDFAGVEKFIDTPVKRYSSGMLVRLGFAVAAHLEPDVLIVDEVLAVGDAEFQNKAIGKMQELSGVGERSVLFVSHNLATIENLCSRSIWLENGILRHDGNTSEIISGYLSSKIKEARQPIHERKDRTGTGSYRIKDLKICNESGDETIRSFDALHITVLLDKKLEGNLLVRIVLGVYERNNNPLFRIDSQNILVKGSGISDRISIKTSEINLVSTLCIINAALYVNNVMADYLVNARIFEIVEKPFENVVLHKRNMATILVPSTFSLT